MYPKDYYDRWYEYARDEKDAALIVNGYRNKPNKPITIYRAVPYQQTKEDLLADLQKAQAQWLKRAKPHPAFESEFHKLGAKKYYEWLGDEEEKVKKSDKEVKNISEINPGDWVTTVRKYADSHGKAHLQNKYRILSKTVTAKEIFTNGDSLCEFSWNP